MDIERAHLSFFGLREQPFAPTADPSYFYATKEHKECLYRLWNSIDARHGISVVLGNYGTGKTALLRKLLTGMAASRERYNTAMVASPIPSWTSFALLEAIVTQFRIPPPKWAFTAYLDTLNLFLMKNRDRVNTLIIDDAQNLNKRGQLELLRLVQNLESHQHKLLNLVLLAQLEWIDILRAAPNFEQRIDFTYVLKPILIEETRHFIEFRLRQAGGEGQRAPQFDDAAIQSVHAYSEGVPRVIVTLCRNALLEAAHAKTRRITADIILQTIERTTLPNPEKRAQAVAAARMTGVPSRPVATTELAPQVNDMSRAAATAEPAAQASEMPRTTAVTPRKSREKKASDMLLRAAERLKRPTEDVVRQING